MVAVHDVAQLMQQSAQHHLKLEELLRSAVRPQAHFDRCRAAILRDVDALQASDRTLSAAAARTA